MSAFSNHFRDYWTNLTQCASDYLVEGCDNFNGGGPTCDPAKVGPSQTGGGGGQGCPAPVFASCQEAAGATGGSAGQLQCTGTGPAPGAPGSFKPFVPVSGGAPQGPHPAGSGTAAPSQSLPSGLSLPGRRLTADYLEALQHLDEVTRRLRRECPWDREQDARSIVPHTVEEAYELADAAQRDDTEAMVDELGDVLFQVLFLSLLLEERGEGDLGAVAESCAAKLIRRHPHVYGDRELETAGQVLAQWEEIKREVEGGQGASRTPSCRRTCRRCSTRARSSAAWIGGRGSPRRSEEQAGRPAGRPGRARRGRTARGTLLMEAVAASRRLGVDPELALREATRRLVD